MLEINIINGSSFKRILGMMIEVKTIGLRILTSRFLKIQFLQINLKLIQIRKNPNYIKKFFKNSKINNYIKFYSFVFNSLEN